LINKAFHVAFVLVRGNGRLRTFHCTT